MHHHLGQWRTKVLPRPVRPVNQSHATRQQLFQLFEDVVVSCRDILVSLFSACLLQVHSRLTYSQHQLFCDDGHRLTSYRGPSFSPIAHRPPISACAASSRWSFACRCCTTCTSLVFVTRMRHYQRASQRGRNCRAVSAPFRVFVLFFKQGGRASSEPGTGTFRPFPLLLFVSCVPLTSLYTAACSSTSSPRLLSD